MQESCNLMRVLEALKTLEDAVLDCKLRAIDTPELHAALDAVEPLSVAGVVRANLRLNVTSSGGDLWSHEGQRDLLRHPHAATRADRQTRRYIRGSESRDRQSGARPVPPS